MHATDSRQNPPTPSVIRQAEWVAQLRQARAGQPDNLLDRLREARRLNPLPPVSHDWLDDLFKQCRDENWAAVSDATEAPQRERRPPAFTKRDVMRAIAAAEQSGHSVERFEIYRDGRIVVFITSERDDPDASEWN